MTGDLTIPLRRLEPSLGLRRRVSLGVTAGLHRIVAGVAGMALAGHPRVKGIPVLRGRGTRAGSRDHLEAALDLIDRFTPGLGIRLRRHITGLFLIHQPQSHGFYSRITGTCTLDIDALDRAPAAELAGTMVRCATEGWLWRSGRGRSRDDEQRILAVSELARLHFLRRAVSRRRASD